MTNYSIISCDKLQDYTNWDSDYDFEEACIHRNAVLDSFLENLPDLW